uniref:Maturase K n=1 Tax=Romanomermis culicivorax TaxID=13658 RepID=A0A915KD29_ROMCU
MEEFPLEFLLFVEAYANKNHYFLPISELLLCALIVEQREHFSMKQGSVIVYNRNTAEDLSI